MAQVVQKPVMIFGTFDVFHPGHRFFIEEARKRIWNLEFGILKESTSSKFKILNSKFFPKLIIVVARDSTVKRLKGVLRNPELVRKKVLDQAFPDATVVLGDEQDPMKVVRKYQPSLVCLGYDQIGFSEQLMRKFPEIKIERIAAYQPEKYKSSKFNLSSRPS